MLNRKLIRLSGFDYSASRNYFFTICVRNHNHSFGWIGNKSMNLSDNGIIVKEQWSWLRKQYPYIELISFIIMPDHVHGIIHINSDYYNQCISGMDGESRSDFEKNTGNNGNNDNRNGDINYVGNGDINYVGNGDINYVGNGDINYVGNGDIYYVGNGRDRSLQSIQPHPTIQPHSTKQTIPKIKPLPELIGAFKTTASKRIHLAGDTMFEWQKSYYEHIIRNNRTLNIIKHYIETNPEHWL